MRATKRCSRCGEKKMVDQFYRTKSTDTPVNPCKACLKAYREAHRDRAKDYRDTHRDERRAWAKAYRSSAHGRRTARSNKEKHRRKHPDRIRARNSVTRAIASGRLVRQPCEICGRPPEIVGGRQIIEAHHHQGYEPEHRFDVQWLCRGPCHSKAETMAREAS